METARLLQHDAMKHNTSQGHDATILADAQKGIERRRADLGISDTTPQDAPHGANASEDDAQPLSHANGTGNASQGTSGGETAPDDWAEVDQAIAHQRKTEKEVGPSYRETLIDDCECVVVAFEKVDVAKVFGKPKWIVHFRVVEGLWKELPLIRGYNPPKSLWFSPHHSLAKDYLAVTGLRLRSLPKRISPRGFLGSFLRDVWVEAETHVVNRRMVVEKGKKSRWVETPAEEHYSTISRLVRRVEGTPRVLQRRSS